MLIFANPVKNKPAPRKAPRKVVKRKNAAQPHPKKGAIMARRKKGMPAGLKRYWASRRGRKTVHRNPTRKASRRHRVHSNPVRLYRRRSHRTPAGKSLFGGGALKEIMSMEGAMMVGAAFAAPMAMDFGQQTIFPSASGWMRLLIKAGILGAGVYALDKFVKKPKVALAFGITGLAVLAADGVNIVRGQMAGLSDAEADYLSTRPDHMAAVLASRGLGEDTMLGDYESGLADYDPGLADDAGNTTSAIWQ